MAQLMRQVDKVECAAVESGSEGAWEEEMKEFENSMRQSGASSSNDGRHGN
jgi:hypothetical protein